MNSMKGMSLTVVLPYSRRDRMKQWKKGSKPSSPITGHITWRTSHEGKAPGIHCTTESLTVQKFARQAGWCLKVWLQVFSEHLTCLSARAGEASEEQEKRGFLNPSSTTGLGCEPLVMTPPLFGPHCSHLKNGSKDPCSFCLKEWRDDQS